MYKTVKDLKVIPGKYLNLPATEGTKLLRCETYVRLKDLKRHYLEEHGRNATTLKHLRNCSVSADGVAESKKGSRTFVAVTVRFGTCLYPVRIFNPLIGVEESKPSPKEILRYTNIWSVSDLYNKISDGNYSELVHEAEEDEDISIKLVLCDMPARRHIQGFNSPNSTYGCGYCTAAAVTKGGTQWPFPKTFGKPYRTKRGSIYFARFVPRIVCIWSVVVKFSVILNCRLHPTRDDKKSKGVVADSALYDITNFDFIWGLAIDVFHICFEGISKLMLVRLFVLRTSKEFRELLMEISFMYEGTRVFSETARKTRRIQVKMMKGNELAVLTLSIFPAIVFCIIEGNTNYWSVSDEFQTKLKSLR